MDDQQSARSAWPDPPAFYKRYTQDNVDLLKVAKSTGVFPEMPISSASVPEFQLQDLEPPSPPTDEYTIFDQKWQVLLIVLRPFLFLLYLLMSFV